MRKNNKGYTLTELLLAMALLAFVMTQIVNIIYNCSALYKKGKFDVDLQTEAQQVVQTVEELSIDCENISASGTTISIEGTDPDGTPVQYLLALNNFNPTYNYYSLTLSVNGSAPQVLAEYVRSMSVDTSKLDTASKIVIDLEMANEEYTYHATKDIYFRNDIGSMMPPPAGDDEYEYTEELNVLRYKTYDLNELFQDEISPISGLPYGASSGFHWSAERNGGSFYSAGGVELSCTDLLNHRVEGMDVDDNEYYVLESDNTDLKIKLYSDDMSFGYAYGENGNFGVVTIVMDFESGGGGNGLITYIPATGISLEDSKEFTITPGYKFFTSSPLMAGGTEYTFFMVKGGGDKIYTPPCSYLAEWKKDHPGDFNPLKDYAFYDDEICYQLAAPEGSTSGEDASVNFNELSIKIYLGTGDEEADEKPILDKDNPKYTFKFEFGNPSFVMDTDNNAIKVYSKRFTDHFQSGWGIKEFYRDGGEVFVDVRVVFPDDYTIDCKGLIYPVGNSFNMDDGSLAADHFWNSLTTDMNFMEFEADDEGNLLAPDEEGGGGGHHGGGGDADDEDGDDDDEDGDDDDEDGGDDDDDSGSDSGDSGSDSGDSGSDSGDKE